MFQISISMDHVNKMDQSEFVEVVGAVFEHSPWVAERSWKNHPFDHLEQMYNVMIKEMHAAPSSLKRSLLRAHPDLGTRLEVSESSRDEQKNAGLSQLTEEEFEEFSMMNKEYTNKFGFPFIMAVKGQDKLTIKNNMKERIHNSYEEEFETALIQVSKIAKFRLDDLIEIKTGKLTTHVLDISVGKPAKQVRIELFKLIEDHQLVKIREARTNSDGRVSEPLLNENELEKGTYQLQFHVGDYYRSNKLEQETYFLEIVPIQFVVSNEEEHYHVPLLLAPGGYSTYRGS
ncbi:2-oxo-4-hydroxy-4-carboxy-5-ureidoimidazoline decarboxylase [Halalkalibacter okhensis]|uniref:2-oxo-4-hydroxy-4-carboxy-5-ureidoimidazoline decarboxylase n=1 Tax=Halalkalibacter okhensis TaxID=333138 RepID=UPI00068D7098|nr:2-oxo-4-hydroxy-4-carboxy-5-ureidoimidazoline decarboxylase [Halalkalibacter okhensis]